MIKLKTFILVLLISTQFTFGQSRAKVNQSIEWSSLNSTIKFHKNVGMYVEGNFRFAKDLQPQQHQFRTGLELYYGKFAFMPIGYVYTWNYKYGEQPAGFVNNEHRLYQQLSFKNSYKRFFFQQRLRLEERFIQGHNKDVTSNDYSDRRGRLRFRSLVNIPLNKAKIEAGAWFVSIWDEIFYSWGKNAYSDDPDQNRLYGGLGYQISKPFSVQAGFIYQYMVKKPTGTQQENNYGGMIQLTYNFDLTNKTK
jgi:hypothetical protein